MVAAFSKVQFRLQANSCIPAISYKADQHEQEGGFSQVLANRFPEKPEQQSAH
jgi:hypothetical protein